MKAGASDPARKGRCGEDVAAAYLEAEGWTIEARNWRCPAGELDIVASRGEDLAFVEVKTVDAYGPEEASRMVGPAKRRRIAESSKYFLLRKREYNRMRPRYDVILVRGSAVDRHIPWAFQEHP
ncbi:MAG TPA: YraN family protein [Magnetospirillaceae bacterium]|nr:YraN family protein [Magnetospirillaceae bacterium]